MPSPVRSQAALTRGEKLFQSLSYSCVTGVTCCAGRVEDAEAIAVGADDAVVIPAHAPVERDVPARLKGVLKVEGVVVLKGEALRVALGLPAARQSAGHEVLEAVEVETPAIAGVEEPVHGRAAKLVAAFPVVPPRVVGEIREGLIVAVDAAARQRQVGADVREARDADLRQAEILRVRTPWPARSEFGSKSWSSGKNVSSNRL